MTGTTEGQRDEGTQALQVQKADRTGPCHGTLEVARGRDTCPELLLGKAIQGRKWGYGGTSFLCPLPPRTYREPHTVEAGHTDVLCAGCVDLHT